MRGNSSCPDKHKLEFKSKQKKNTPMASTPVNTGQSISLPPVLFARPLSTPALIAGGSEADVA